MLTARTAAIVFCSVLVGCSSSDPPEDQGFSGWEGEEPHFTATGTLDGENVDIHVSGSEAADTARLWCEREYAVPRPEGGAADLSLAEFTEAKIDGFATVGGEERPFEIELKHHSLQTDQDGDRITIVPRDDLVDPGPGEMWFEWEWHSADRLTELLETAAQEGTVTRGMFTGTPGEGGVVIQEGEGRIGAYVEARWGVDQSLHISFSADCTLNLVEEFQP